MGDDVSSYPPPMHKEMLASSLALLLSLNYDSSKWVSDANFIYQIHLFNVLS